VLKRPPNSVIQPEPEGQNEKPVGSFWTTMAEEDEQRLFTEKVNKTFSECLNLINKVTLTFVHIKGLIGFFVVTNTIFLKDVNIQCAKIDTYFSPQIFLFLTFVKHIYKLFSPLLSKSSNRSYY
jgi:hypothetical protein